MDRRNVLKEKVELLLLTGANINAKMLFIKLL